MINKIFKIFTKIILYIIAYSLIYRLIYIVTNIEINNISFYAGILFCIIIIAINKITNNTYNYDFYNKLKDYNKNNNKTKHINEFIYKIQKAYPMLIIRNKYDLDNNEAILFYTQEDYMLDNDFIEYKNKIYDECFTKNKIYDVSFRFEKEYK
jgi:hypothetical protein